MQLPIKVKPYSHQVQAVKFATGVLGYSIDVPNENKNVAKSKGVAILAEMGVGKSVMTVALAGLLWQGGHVKKLLIIAPLSITGVWREEFSKFADYDYCLEILDGSSLDKQKALQRLERASKGEWVRGEQAQDRLQVAVINYESAWRFEVELAHWLAGKRDGKGILQTFSMVVCDESSKIKNPQAKQSKALHRLGRLSKHNIILTGTPVANSPLDMYSQYKFVDEQIFGTSFYVFRAKYAILGGYGNHQIIGYKNLDDLTSKAQSIAYRITKAEALDLPETVDIVRQIELEPRAIAIYKQVEKESVAELESGEITTPNVLTKLLRLSQITGGYLKSADGERVENISQAKLSVLEEIVDECLESSKKLVVFARFIPEIDAIERMLKKKGIGYSLIKGDVKDRAEQVERFQNDDSVRVFVGQLQTTSVGLTLTAADTALFFSLDYSSSNHEQAKARIHRIGQKNNCTYIYLIARGTIDEKVMQALKDKRDIAKLVVDDYKQLFKAKLEDK